MVLTATQDMLTRDQLMSLLGVPSVLQDLAEGETNQAAEMEQPLG